jgi:hypothetical protein
VKSAVAWIGVVGSATGLTQEVDPFFPALSRGPAEIAICLLAGGTIFGELSRLIGDPGGDATMTFAKLSAVPPVIKEGRAPRHEARLMSVFEKSSPTNRSGQARCRARA